MSSSDAAILWTCLFVVVAVAAIVNRLRPRLQLVVLIGTLVLLCEVAYPPCVNPDGTKSRYWATDDITYYVGGFRPWVDVGQQYLWMSATVLGTATVCCVLELQHRFSTAAPPDVR
jgi:hypothetical protein